MRRPTASEAPSESHVLHEPRQPAASGADISPSGRYALYDTPEGAVLFDTRDRREYKVLEGARGSYDVDWDENSGRITFTYYREPYRDDTVCREMTVQIGDLVPIVRASHSSHTSH